jgi:predicted polyphosphate/ATP-dependent NAD kinase
MAGAPKEKLSLTEETETSTDETSEREVFLRDGKKLVVSDQGADQIVEIRNESGMLEVRIKLTDQGPVLQMEGARLSMKATESVEIESNKVSIKAEELTLSGTNVTVTSEEDVHVNANGEVRVVGKMIYLN